MASQGFFHLSSLCFSISKNRLQGDRAGVVKLTQTSRAGMGVQCLTWIMASKLGKWPSRAPEKHNLEIRTVMSNPLGVQWPLQYLAT